MPDAPQGGRVRFHLLRTIQTFALDRLVGDGDETEIRRRHAEAYRALVSACERHLNTSRHAEMLDRIDPEIPNIRSAMRWTIDAGAGELALRLAGGLWRFWHASGLLDEGRRLDVGGPGHAGRPDVRFRASVGRGRGRQPRVLAGRLGDGAGPVRGGVAGRTRRGRRGGDRGCALQSRARIVPRLRARGRGRPARLHGGCHRPLSRPR